MNVEALVPGEIRDVAKTSLEALPENDFELGEGTRRSTRRSPTSPAREWPASSSSTRSVAAQAPIRLRPSSRGRSRHGDPDGRKKGWSDSPPVERKSHFTLTFIGEF